MAALLENIGPLSAIVVPGRSQKAVVLCHGYGASASDLAPLSSYLDRQEEFTWVFPEAPIAVPIGFGITGRAWFPIDYVELERIARTGDWTTWARTRPSGLDAATAQVFAMLQVLRPRFKELYLGGFSQGSMVTLDMVLAHHFACAGLVIMSGTLIDETSWEKHGPRLAGQRYFLSHGGQDPVLPAGLAEKLDGALRDWGWQGDTCFFAGAHEIPPAVLNRLSVFLRPR